MEPEKINTNNHIFDVTATESKTVIAPTQKKQVIFRVVAQRESDGRRPDFVAMESNAIPIDQLEPERTLTGKICKAVDGEEYDATDEKNTAHSNDALVLVSPRPTMQGRPYQLTT